jgi:hypothetical protein
VVESSSGEAMAKQVKKLNSVPIKLNIEWTPQREKVLVDWVAEMIADRAVKDLMAGRIDENGKLLSPEAEVGEPPELSDDSPNSKD